MKHISPAALKEKLDNGEAVELVDVREAWEHEAFNIGGTLIPFSDFSQYSSSIPRDRPVVLYCKMGVRSQIVIQRLEEKEGFTNLVNLQGGLQAWKNL